MLNQTTLLIDKRKRGAQFGIWRKGRRSLAEMERVWKELNGPDCEYYEIEHKTYEGGAITTMKGWTKDNRQSIT